MSKRALLVYNICGIKKDNTNVYPRFMQGIRNQYQNFSGEIKTIISGCKTHSHTMPTLKSLFPEFDYLEVNDNLTVNITFNNAVLKGVDKYGEFDTYSFITSDALLESGSEIEGMTNNIRDNPNIGMYSAQIDIDSCYAYGLKLGGGRHGVDDERARYEMFKDGSDYIVPVGKACAAHLNIYTNEFFQFYGRCCPDIFAGYCTESTFSFANAAIKKNWVISKDYLIKHLAGMDGPSSGFDPEGHKLSNPNKGSYDHPFIGDTLMPIFDNEYAKSIGLGYEECQDVVIHDDSQFDDNQFCVNEELKEYIRDNLFLSNDKFNYNKIDCEWING
tara:strand:+ start:121 stop:1113 length:993 start_codon:yes stop_codon:yes gene_type:complete